MIKPKLLIAALAVSLFFAKANAQDSTHYDIGRIQLKKDFTQGITVKGADLEKMPFTNLSEAINVWFYGTYSNSATLVYIIDGNLVNDVNAYSIYDIDEVTLIQNAVTSISGGAGPQQLVVVKTKRAKLKGFGVIANAQTDISSLYTNNNDFNAQTNTYQTGLKSTTTVYQQYYVSAYENTGNIKAGISVDYLRDVLPVIKEQGVTYATPQSLNRLKFNGYFDIKIGASMLDVTASYDPEKGKDVFNNSSSGYQQATEYEYVNNHIFNGTVSFNTHIAPGLTNTIHGDYNYIRDNSYGNELITSSSTSNTSNYKDEEYDHNIVAYDNLSYDLKLGNWSLEPAVNLNFRTFRDSTYYGSFYYDASGNTTGYGYGSGKTKMHLFLLTPSVNLYYKTYFNIQGGFLDDLATFGEYYQNNVKPKKVLPFVTASADVMQLINSNNNAVALKIFGSYAANDLFTDNFNSLPGLSSPYTQVPVEGTNNTDPYYGSVIYSADPASIYNGTDKVYKTYSAGLTISPVKTGLALSYFFEKSSYLSPIFVYEPYSGNSTQIISFFTNTNLILNRLSLSYKLVKNTFSWQTNINATMIKQSYEEDGLFAIKPTLGSGEWTGGWVNRLSYRNLFAGADLLYQVGQKQYSESNTSAVVLTKINSFSLQNLYAGYRLKIKGLKDPEIFANARNIFQNKKEDITDGRKYYGLGLNFGL